MLFSKNQGVLWQIQSPVKADLVVTSRKLVQKTQRTSSQIEVDKTPYGSVATMFLQLMSGNEAALAKNFNVVSANYSPTQWNVSLKPKSSLFKSFLSKSMRKGSVMWTVLRFWNKPIIAPSFVLASKQLNLKL